jgi:hypothetical protein
MELVRLKQEQAYSKSILAKYTTHALGVIIHNSGAVTDNVLFRP